MPTLTLIEPKSPNLHIFSGMALPRLGCLILGTLARTAGWNVHIIIEDKTPLNWDLINKADLVGISTITSTAPRAFALADHCRQRNIPTIIGGPHVTFLPNEALEHSPFVMRGEGEIAFPRFLEEFLSSKNWSSVPNLSWHNGTENVHNEMTTEMVDLDEIPIPDFSLLNGDPLVMGGKTVIPIQTSRGCPFDCSFCSVTSMFGRKFRWRSTDKIMEELRQYNNRSNFIFFYDDNFMANAKRAHELLDAMIAEKMRIRWSAQVRADLAKDTILLRKMRQAGCFTVFIGFESVNPESLKAMHKQATVEDMARAATNFRHAGIHVHGMFILGTDQDTKKSVRATVRFARKHKISTAQFLILIPLPGTDTFKEMDEANRLVFRDWSLYDAHHVVYAPKHFSMQALQREQVKAHRIFYAKRNSIRRFFEMRFEEIGIAFYARNLNKRWKKMNKPYLKLIKLLRPQRNCTITADFRQNVLLDREHDKAA